MAIDAYPLAVRFVDGLSGTVRVEHGAITWPGDLDLAPDAMHAAIKEHREWKLA